MKKLKNLLLVFVIVALSLCAFTACFENDETPSNSTTNESTINTPSNDTTDTQTPTTQTPTTQTPSGDTTDTDKKTSVGLQYERNSIGWTVKGKGTCTDTDIVIPQFYEKLKVTSIGEKAFFYCSSLTSIVISNSVTSIASSAFSGCSSLTSIVIPNSVTSIASSAFSGCSSLTSIVIPKSVTSIREGAFDDCSGLTSITVQSGNTKYRSAGNCLIETSNKTLILGCKNSVIPTDGSVTNIGSHAFWGCSDLTSVEIPNNVTSIGNGAFAGCASLTSIVIPRGVTSIGDAAFRGCSSLYYIENNSDLVFTFGSNEYGEIALYAKVIKVIEYENGKITYKDKNYLIENDFLFTKGLYDKYELIAYLGKKETVKLPNAIKGETYTIYRMRGVKNVIIPEGMIVIGNSAFHNCSSLTSIVIPNGVTIIGNGAFYGCRGLTSIVIPKSVTSIREGAFEGCSSLTSITVESGNTNYHSAGNCLIETSSKKLIAGCNVSIIPTDGSVTSIGQSAFGGCSSLTIEIPNSVTSIGNDAFKGCSGLTSIEIPNNVTSIGTHAFKGCSGLTSIVIPNSVTSIGWAAFEGCSSLTIYCEAKHKPEGWDSDWNYKYLSTYCPVVWGYTGEGQ